MDGLPSPALDHEISGSNRVAEQVHEAPPAVPRWVKLFGMAAIILLLLLAGLHLTGLAPTHGMPMHDMPMS